MSCGPVNAVQKLSSHAQVDRSLHQDASQRRAVNGQSFRSNDGMGMEREFQLHQQSQAQFDPMFANAFQRPMSMQPPHQQHQPLHQHPQQYQEPQQGSSSWASDFTAANAPAKSQSRQQANSWNTQFMNQMGAQRSSQMGGQQFYQPPQVQQNYALNTSGMSMGTSIGTSMGLMGTQRLNNSYMQAQVEDTQLLDPTHADLEREFQSLEKQFEDNVKLEEEPIGNRNSNAEFREAARQVEKIMKSTDSEKFANSKFLNLMTKVTNGQVELNEDETKLVDANGEDIHEKQLKSQIGEKADTKTNPLPDPLANVPDEAFETPFQSARLVGQQHNERYSWDEMYDDYKHDDTSF